MRNLPRQPLSKPEKPGGKTGSGDPASSVRLHACSSSVLRPASAADGRVDAVSELAPDGAVS